MTRITVTLALLFFFCGCPGQRPPNTTDGDPDGSTDADVETDPDADQETEVDCTDIPELPLPFETIRGPIAGEDFAFDRDGNMVGNDEEGNIVLSTIDGQTRVFVPHASEEIAGMRFLNDGRLVYADVMQGALYRVDSEGNREQILAGLDYPNGIEIGLDNFIYVTEQSAGQVRRVNPDNGEFTIIATDIYAPNGITFSPDYRTLYVGSFGFGRVYRMSIDEQGQAGPIEEFAQTPNAPDEIPDIGGKYDLPKEAWDWEASQWLEWVRNHEELEVPEGAESWTVDQWWSWFDSKKDPYGLPKEAYDWTASQWREWVENHPELEVPEGSESWDVDEWWTWYEESLWGEFGEHGGLDGMAVDACGYIYVTEYVIGCVWRISPDGQTVEQLFNPPTEWVPNMHWGSGVGGWDPNTLYVVDRELETTYAIEMGITCKPRLFP